MQNTCQLAITFSYFIFLFTTHSTTDQWKQRLIGFYFSREMHSSKQTNGQFIFPLFSISYLTSVLITTSFAYSLVMCGVCFGNSWLIYPQSSLIIHPITPFGICITDDFLILQETSIPEIKMTYVGSCRKGLWEYCKGSAHLLYHLPFICLTIFVASGNKPLVHYIYLVKRLEDLQNCNRSTVSVT